MDERQHAAVEAIYHAALEPEAWPPALQAIADCFGDVGAALIYSRDDGRWGVHGSPSLAPMLQEYLERWSDRDIRAIRARERGYFLTRDVITDRDVVSDAEMARAPNYTELLASYGLRYFAGANVAPHPGVQVALSVQRAADRPPYSEAELADVGRLARHVETSLKLSMAVIESSSLASGLSQALDNGGVAVLGLDTLGRITFSNALARSLLDDGDGDAPAGTLLRDLDAAARTALREANGRPGGASEGRPVLVDTPSRRRPLVARFLPLTDAAQGPFGTAEVLALVCDPTAGGEIDASLLRDLFGMTLGEARVAALVGAGFTLREASDRLGLKEQSVRSVLKRVFDKAQVSRQAELTLLMQRLRLTI